MCPLYICPLRFIVYVYFAFPHPFVIKNVCLFVLLSKNVIIY